MLLQRQPEIDRSTKSPRQNKGALHDMRLASSLDDGSLLSRGALSSAKGTNKKQEHRSGEQKFHHEISTQFRLIVRRTQTVYWHDHCTLLISLSNWCLAGLEYLRNELPPLFVPRTIVSRQCTM